MLVFIDESGDPGFKLKKGSSAVFVAALVAFHDRDQARTTRAAIDAAAVRLRIRPEFKFNKCRDETRYAFFETVRPFEFRVRAIVVKKELIYSPLLRSKTEAFYSFFVKTMLNFDNGLLKDARIVIDGSGDRGFRQELEAYLRRELGRGRVKSIRCARKSTTFGNFDESVRPICPSRRSLRHAHPPVTVRTDGATLPPINEIPEPKSQITTVGTDRYIRRLFLDTHRRIAISLFCATLNFAAPLSMAAVSSGASTLPSQTALLAIL
jgi:hypothetical protein